MLSPQQERSWRLNGSASAGTFSQRRTFGSRFCLLSPDGYLKNDDLELTADPTHALQWADQETAIAKMLDLAHPFESLHPKEVHYDVRRGQWIPVRA